MRNLLRRLRRGGPSRPTTARHRAPDRTRPVGATNAGRHYRSAAYRPLCAGRVRDRRFTLVRRGLDPGEVTAFLHQVADDLTELHAELDRIRDENIHIKRSLRDWQSRFAPRVYR
ncbi:DivIVA domain-containing protein [Micromonospora pallida]|uniref:DivIVA domain-containing protein n=1 Tax=Micromonospora pallida TaxID=145854 RepID=A0A1C6TFA7_9ACTN|nr:DivIVA domain-containing protein [Micromonospora pallida]SCL40357.1 DivIVA domain-containing protein [Micromonospora pallida]